MRWWQRSLVYGLIVVGLMVHWHGPQPSTWPSEAVAVTLTIAFVAAVVTEWLIWVVEEVLR